MNKKNENLNIKQHQWNNIISLISNIKGECYDHYAKSRPTTDGTRLIKSYNYFGP